MHRPPYAASIATLTAIPVACLATSTATPGGATLLGAGLAGLAGLALASERWKRRAGLPSDDADHDPAHAAGTSARE